MYLDPLYYTVYGLVASQLADVTDIVITTPDGDGATVQQYMHSYYGFHTWVSAVALTLACTSGWQQASMTCGAFS